MKLEVKKTDNLQDLEKWLKRNPGPWTVTMWTYAEDGRPPIEFTAGLFSSRVDTWEVSNGIVHFWAEDGSSKIVLIAQALGDVKEVLSEGQRFVRFGYANLTTNADGFIPHVIFTINQSD